MTMASNTRTITKQSTDTARKRSHKWVWLFEEGGADMRDLLGGKGAGVAEMTRAGLPVPPGFTITTEACNAFYESGKKFPEGLWDQVLSALEHGVELALATDCNPGTCYAESMPLMMSLAVAYAGLTPEVALRAATLGGAHALRLHDRGMVSPGMRADLLVLSTPSWIDLSYHMGASLVQLIVQSGRIIPRGLTHVI